MGGLTRLLPTLALGIALVAVPSASALRPAPGLHVAPGLKAELYATGLHHPTALAFGPGGVLYATQDSGELVAVGRGTARPRAVVRGLRVPLGLAWDGNVAYVSTQGALLRLVVRSGRVVSRRTLVRGLPYGLHQQDTVALGPDGRLYLGSGSTCNACVERDRRSAAILSFRRDGSDLRVVARGLRNPYGLAFHPRTGALYASVNGRDDLGAIRAGRDDRPRPPGRTLRLAGLLEQLGDRPARADAAPASPSPSPSSSPTPRRTASPSGAVASSSPSGAST